MKQDGRLKEISNETRGMSACRACEMTLKRSRAAGKDMSKPENVFCMDCHDGIYNPVVKEVRMCRKCNSPMTDSYKLCRDCKPQHEVDFYDFSDVRFRLNSKRGA